MNLAGLSSKLRNKRSKGQYYEAAAERHLSACGLELIERNFLTKSGEIDLVMRDGTAIVFVEVRYRSSQAFGHAAETVTYRKMQKLQKAANVWLMKQGMSIYSTDFRFDVVAIHQQGQQIEWIKNAITQG
ncbi:YraN family protein [Vibrio nereis]|uniref:YraN family protein n=1 Tax=Vibrio nereis TaxID=693 RepID=UPI001FDF40AB|nr:YraN family protein [Vibrio nereis]